MALAAALKRTLVLPRYPCLCDRSEGPNIIETCTYEGSDLTLPFVCPLSHIFDLYRFRELGARAGRLAAARQPPPRLDIQLREHAFLTNPLRPPAAADAAATLAVARNASAAAALRAAGVPYIVDGASDAQARAAEASFKLRGKEVVHLESAEGVFGGTADAEDAREFEMLMSRHVMGLSWCCTSWYKPSGTFPYADPPPTAVLPKRCGEGDAAAAAAPRVRGAAGETAGGAAALRLQLRARRREGRVLRAAAAVCGRAAAALATVCRPRFLVYESTLAASPRAPLPPARAALSPRGALRRLVPCPSRDGGERVAERACSRRASSRPSAPPRAAEALARDRLRRARAREFVALLLEDHVRGARRRSRRRTPSHRASRRADV